VSGEFTVFSTPSSDGRSSPRGHISTHSSVTALLVVFLVSEARSVSGYFGSSRAGASTLIRCRVKAQDVGGSPAAASIGLRVKVSGRGIPNRKSMLDFIDLLACGSMQSMQLGHAHLSIFAALYGAFHGPPMIHPSMVPGIFR
jgi:hypothetical protein